MLSVALATLLAAAPPLVTAEGVTLEEDGKAPFALPFAGVQLDVGAPEGIGASLVVTPARYLRLSLGGLSNGVGAGARVGVALVGFPTSSLRPLLGVDAGYVFGGQGAWLPQLITDPTLRAAVTGVSVGFVNAQVGVEIGSRHFAVTLRGGLSYVGLNASDQALSTGGASTITVRGITLSGFLPSARLGLLFCFG